MDDLAAIGKTAGSAMRAQSLRMRVISENMANAQTTGTTPGADPYRRKTVDFAAAVDAATGANMVEVEAIGEDPSDFGLKYDPAHPAADAAGYVKTPNVNAMVELANMREASRSYEANLNMVEAGRRMRSQLLNMMSN